MTHPSRNTISQTTPDARLYHRERNVESDRRLQVLSEVREEYAKYDFIEGMTVFGSTVHGNAHEKSDIDTCVFVDPDKLIANHGGTELNVNDYKGLARIIERDLAGKLNVSAGNLSSGERCDVRVYPINERIARQIVDVYAAQKATYDQYDNQRSELFDNKIEAGTYDYKKFANEVREVLGDEPQHPLIAPSVSKLFHPAVGDQSELTRLRCQAIAAIDESPHREELWEDVVLSVRMFEGSLHDGGLLFPESIDEAKELYLASNV